MTKVIGFAVELAGCPIVKGGAQNLLSAFERLIRDQAEKSASTPMLPRFCPVR